MPHEALIDYLSRMLNALHRQQRLMAPYPMGPVWTRQYHSITNQLLFALALEENQS